MAAAGLHFVGQLPLYANYRDLTIPPALLPAFKEIDNRILFESLKDFAVNEFFRRDVYVRGVVGQTTRRRAPSSSERLSERSSRLRRCSAKSRFRIRRCDSPGLSTTRS